MQPRASTDQTRIRDITPAREHEHPACLACSRWRGSGSGSRGVAHRAGCRSARPWSLWRAPRKKRSTFSSGCPLILPNVVGRIVSRSAASAFEPQSRISRCGSGRATTVASTETLHCSSEAFPRRHLGRVVEDVVARPDLRDRACFGKLMRGWSGAGAPCPRLDSERLERIDGPSRSPRFCVVLAAASSPHGGRRPPCAYPHETS